MDGEAARALRRPLARARRRRHQLRDARARPADARLRPPPAQGPHHRRARRPRGRDDQDPRRRRAEARPLDADDLRLRAPQRRRRHHGRRGLRHRARHHLRPPRKRALRARLHQVHRLEARPRERVQLPLHPRRRQGPRGLRLAPRRAPPAAARRREGRQGPRRRRQPPAAAQPRRLARLRARAPPHRHPRRQRRDGLHPQAPRVRPARQGGPLCGRQGRLVRRPVLALGHLRRGRPRGGDRPRLRARQHPGHHALRPLGLAALRRAFPRRLPRPRGLRGAGLLRGPPLLLPLRARARRLRPAPRGQGAPPRHPRPGLRRVRRHARLAAAPALRRARPQRLPRGDGDALRDRQGLPFRGRQARREGDARALG